MKSTVISWDGSFNSQLRENGTNIIDFDIRWYVLSLIFVKLCCLLCNFFFFSNFWCAKKYRILLHFRDKERHRSRSRSRTPDKESDRFIAKEKKRLEDLRLKIDKAKLREIAMWVLENSLLAEDCENLKNWTAEKSAVIIPPANYVCGGGILFSRCPSVHPSFRPSVTFWFFFNILKRQWWKFIKFCRHIDIDKMYVYNRKLRARGQFCWSYCPL